MKSTFTIKRLSREPKFFHYIALAVIFLSLFLGGYRVFMALRASLQIPVAGAHESLTFTTVLPQKCIALPHVENACGQARKIGISYWQLLGGTDEQNEVLRKCQDKLREANLPDEAVKYGCSILLAENEPLTPERLGDGGHSFGICQRYLKGQSAKKFLEKNPEWKTVETQLEYCTGRYIDAYRKFGNVFQATVSHNCPACAARNQDAWHLKPPYFQRVKRATQKLSFL